MFVARTGILGIEGGKGKKNGEWLELRFDGKFSLDVPGQKIEWATDRGELPADPEEIEGPDQPMTGNFEAKQVTILSDASNPVPLDLIGGRFGAGKIGTWQSTIGESRSMTYHVWYYDRREWVKVPHCLIRGGFSEADDGNTLSFTFTSAAAYPKISATGPDEGP